MPNRGTRRFSNRSHIERNSSDPKRSGNGPATLAGGCLARFEMRVLRAPGSIRSLHRIGPHFGGWQHAATGYGTTDSLCGRLARTRMIFGVGLPYRVLSKLAI